MENLLGFAFNTVVAQSGHSKIILCNIVQEDGSITAEIWVFHHSVGAEFENMKDAWENYNGV